MIYEALADLDSDPNFDFSIFTRKPIPNYSYIYDPRNPVPTLGGTNLMIDSGSYDQSSIEDREDVIIFETDVLSEKINVVGRMWANLWVMSNSTNTDFTVKITDVYPDGRSMLVTDGIINAIRRDGVDTDASPLNSSGPVKVVIDLWSTAYQFNIGQDYKVDLRKTGRFFHYKITDTSPLGVGTAEKWSISGMQAKVGKRGAR